MYYLVSLDARYWRKIERHCVLLLHTCLARQLMVVPWTHIEVFYVCFQVKLKEEEEEEGRKVSDLERQVLALPVRFGGIGI